MYIIFHIKNSTHVWDYICKEFVTRDPKLLIIGAAPQKAQNVGDIHSSFFLANARKSNLAFLHVPTDVYAVMNM